MPMARYWGGLTLEERKNRATGRALIAIGMEATVATKRITHKISGTLARSVHPAPAGYDPDENREEDDARSSDLLRSFMDLEPTHLPGEVIIEVGSWLPYACAEWVGRGHPGITQGLELARAKTDVIIRQAFREEGL